MSGNLRVGSDLFDQYSGLWVGKTDYNGGEQIVIPGGFDGHIVGTFGDSMGDYNWSVTTTGTASFDPTTNLLSITIGSGHNASLGALVNVWHRSYASLTVMQQLPVYDVVSSTVYRVRLDGAIGAYPDLPNGALISSPTLFTVPSWLKASKGWMRWLCALGNQRWRLAINQCQSGDTTAQMLTRIQAARTAFRAAGVNTVVMHGIGVNDLTIDSIGTSNDLQQTWANIVKIFDTFRQDGMRLIISTLTPVATGEARAQKSIMSALQELNRIHWNYARRYGHRVLMLDAYPVIALPTDATGLANGNYVSSADHIHLNNVGAYKIAKAVLAQATAFCPSSRTTLPQSTLDSRANAALASPTGNAAGGVVTITAAASYIQKTQEVFIRGATGSYTGLNGRQVALATDASGSFRVYCPGCPDGAVTGTLVVSPSRQLFADPLLLGSTAANVANGATGTTLSALKVSNNSGNTGTMTYAASVVAAADGFGNAQRIRVTAAAVNDRPYVSLNASVGTLDNQMTPGRTYEWEAQVRYAVGSAWANAPLSEIDFEMNIGYTDGGVAQTARGSDLVAYDNVAPLFDSSDALSVTLHLRTSAVTIPSTATITSCQIIMSTRFQNTMSTDTLDIEWSRLACRDVTQDGPEF